ncbi:carbohydrate sulfotransferase 12-like [Thalassophryne amazonica]|uniref:carbohydrate sulfotransferase 12-like n=1 Tax=Thalassophryne amazonica TaxID=390379 RepID=UPI001471EB04|nr:carbohydrate sulfotransferase 12-like [Thalassophryne amazonica]
MSCAGKNPTTMTTPKGFLLLLGFVTFTLPVTYYYWITRLHDKTEVRKQRQELRKQLIIQMCKTSKQVFSQMKHNLEDLTSLDLENFIVNDEYAVIYCYIPKVACTNGKRLMISLNKGKPYQDLMSIHPDVVQNYNFHYLSHLPKPEQQIRLKHFKKFLFVRDPFNRLLSAFRGKFQKFNWYFYENYAWHILHHFGHLPEPTPSMHEAFTSGLFPSFNNFIEYLLDPQTEKNVPFEPHWRQMHRLCHPCHIQFDFIGHQETLQDDAEQLLNLLNLQDDIKFPPSYENMTSSNMVLDWFRTVPLEDRRKLYNMYEEDFRLFGYEKPNSLLDE